MRYKLQLCAKAIFLAICVFIALGGHYPPAYSQNKIQPVPVLTVEDAVQDRDIDEINHHLEATDIRVQKEWDAINKNSLDISGMQGEERIIGGVLALLSSAGLILQVRKKPA